MPVIEMTKLRYKLLTNLDRDGKPVRQWKVAAECMMSENAISRYVRGVCAYRQDHLHRLCAYFDCDPNELAGSIKVEIPDQSPMAG